MRNPIIVLCGLPGVGKTTASKYLIDNLGYHHYRTEDIRNMMGFTEYSELQRPLVREMMKELAYKNSISQMLENMDINENNGVILDANHAQMHLREWIYEYASILNLEVILVHMTCSEDSSIRRMLDRPTVEGKVASPNDISVYYRLKSRFEDPALDLQKHRQLSLLEYNSDVDTVEQLGGRIRDALNSLKTKNLYYIINDYEEIREIGPKALSEAGDTEPIFSEVISGFSLASREFGYVEKRKEGYYFIPGPEVDFLLSVNDPDATHYLATRKGLVSSKASQRQEPKPIKIDPGVTTLYGYSSKIGSFEELFALRIGSP